MRRSIYNPQSTEDLLRDPYAQTLAEIRSRATRLGAVTEAAVRNPKDLAALAAHPGQVHLAALLANRRGHTMAALDALREQVQDLQIVLGAIDEVMEGLQTEPTDQERLARALSLWTREADGMDRTLDRYLRCSAQERDVVATVLQVWRSVEATGSAPEGAQT